MCFWLDNVTVIFLFLHFINKYKATVILPSLIAQVYKVIVLQGFLTTTPDSPQYDGLNLLQVLLTPIETFIFLVCMSHDYS